MARHFLTGAELTAEQQLALLDRAIELKADRLSSRALEGKSVALVFDKPSTRTRVSFDVGVSELGGHAVSLRQGEVQMARGESPRDIALVLSRMVHAIGVRTGPHELLEELAEHASVPVINMLSSDHHPCQALADLITLRERFGRLEGLKLAYVGDGNNMARSLLVAGAHRGHGGGDRVAARAVAAGGARRLARGGRRRRARALHGRVGEHGRRRRTPRAGASCSSRTGSTPSLLAQGARRRDRPPLPARAPGRGDHRGRALRRALGGLGPGREPPARAEGAPRASTLRAMTKLIALILACLALGLAACGGDDDSGGGSGSGSDRPVRAAAAPAAEARACRMENIQFNPKDLTIKAGQTVTFTNDESVPHDVHKESGPGGDFASGPDGGMQQGDTFKLKLDKPGTYKYVCHVHAPGMAGTITVK